MTIKSRDPYGDRHAVFSLSTRCCVSAMHGFLTITSRQSSSPIGREGNAKIFKNILYSERVHFIRHTVYYGTQLGPDKNRWIHPFDDNDALNSRDCICA